MRARFFLPAASALALLGAGWAAGTLSAADASRPAEPALERMAIENTMQDYVRALDGSDLDAYLATLAEDARFLSKEGNYYGKQAIADYVKPVMDSRRKKMAEGTDTSRGTHHIVTNEALRFTDADHAEMRSYWMFASAGDKGITVSLMGSSEDSFVKQDGKWLIVQRKVETL